MTELLKLPQVQKLLDLAKRFDEEKLLKEKATKLSKDELNRLFASYSVDFLKAIEAIIQFASESKKLVGAEVLRLQEPYQSAAAELENARSEAQEITKSIRAETREVTEERLNGAIDQFRKIITRMAKEQVDGLSFLYDRVSRLKDGYIPVKGKDYSDGKDADPTQVARLVLAQLMPVIEKKVKELDDIEKLRDEVKELRDRPVHTGISGRSFIKEVDISSQLDGVTKTFNIGAFYRIIAVDASSSPYGAFRKTTDYTYSGNDGTITFTSQIDAATQLSAGQSVIIIIVLS